MSGFQAVQRFVYELDNELEQMPFTRLDYIYWIATENDNLSDTVGYMPLMEYFHKNSYYRRWFELHYGYDHTTEFYNYFTDIYRMYNLAQAQKAFRIYMTSILVNHTWYLKSNKSPHDKLIIYYDYDTKSIIHKIYYGDTYKQMTYKTHLIQNIRLILDHMKQFPTIDNYNIDIWRIKQDKHKTVLYY